MLVRASTTLTGLNYAKKIKLKDSIGNETDRPKTAYCEAVEAPISRAVESRRNFSNFEFLPFVPTLIELREQRLLQDVAAAAGCGSSKTWKQL